MTKPLASGHWEGQALRFHRLLPPRRRGDGERCPLPGTAEAVRRPRKCGRGGGGSGSGGGGGAAASATTHQPDAPRRRSSANAAAAACQPPVGVQRRWRGRRWRSPPPPPHLRYGPTSRGGSAHGCLLNATRRSFVFSGKELPSSRLGRPSRAVQLHLFWIPQGRHVWTINELLWGSWPSLRSGINCHVHWHYLPIEAGCCSSRPHSGASVLACATSGALSRSSNELTLPAQAGREVWFGRRFSQQTAAVGGTLWLPRLICTCYGDANCSAILAVRTTDPDRTRAESPSLVRGRALLPCYTTLFPSLFQESLYAPDHHPGGPSPQECRWRRRSCKPPTTVLSNTRRLLFPASQ